MVLHGLRNYHEGVSRVMPKFKARYFFLKKKDKKKSSYV